jgi:hypothetical protein
MESSETLSSGVSAWIIGRQVSLRVIPMVIAIVIVNVQVPIHYICGQVGWRMPSGYLTKLLDGVCDELLNGLLGGLLGGLLDGANICCGYCA